MRTHAKRIYRGKNHFRLNKFAAFFGSNGSGKSNFDKALSKMAKIILFGIDTCDAKPFRFADESNTSFEVELYLHETLYSYGFTCNLNERTITDEWLCEVKLNKDVFYLKRENGKSSFIHDRFLKKEEIRNRLSAYMAEADENNKLLLLPMIVRNTAKSNFQNELHPFYDVFDFFLSKLNLTSPQDFVSINAVDLTQQDNLKKFGDMLKRFDTGITSVIQTEVSEEKFRQEVPQGIYERIVSDFKSKDDLKTAIVRSASDFWVLKRLENNDVNFHKIQFIHYNQIDKPFDLKDESDGTKRLFTLLDILLWENDGTTFIVDEIDRCLHPCLTRQFIKEFLKLADQPNYRNQLIVSTHESKLMNLQFLRRDEIWFAENEGVKGSKIYPFDQYNERYDKVIEKAYLDGRFGAIPLFEEAQGK